MKNYEIPKAFEYQTQHLRRINKNSVKELFTHLVRRLYFANKHDEFLNHNQMSNLVFWEKDSKDLKKIVNEYGNYFIRKGQKKKIDLSKVFEDHQYIFTGQENTTKEFCKEQLIKAIDDEIKESYKHENNNAYPIHSIKKITERSQLYIYSAIVDIDSDMVNFSEGATAYFSNVKRQNIRVTILAFDSKLDRITFQTAKEILAKKGSLKSSSVSILYKMKERIEEVEKNTLPLWDILESGRKAKRIDFANSIYSDGLDQSQFEALQKVLSSNYVYIWGPPGTGKSYLLSRLIYNLNEYKEKTIVCSIANVAVDSLLLKTINLLNERGHFDKRKSQKKEKIFLRLGYAQADEIRNLKDIQFESKILTNLSEKIKDLDAELIYFNEKKILSETDLQKQSNLISAKDEIKREYDKQSKIFLSNANVIFMTSSKFIMEEVTKNLEIDNLIIDEGSMMSIPSLVVLAANVKKRVIIAGDFMQLGPIALSNSEFAKRWLHNDLFSLLGKSEQIPNHEAVTMLDCQRRSAKEIITLINNPFYNGKLKTYHQTHHDRKFNTPLLKNFVSFLHLPDNEQNTAEYSRSRSKYNKTSKDIVWNLVLQIIKNEDEDITIGIITPYRQQVKDYRYLMDKHKISAEKLVVGTIHTFQGSEKDIIIWDIVDTPQKTMGVLYKGETGERIVNVAISRAKLRIVIAGYPRVFNEAKGNDLVSMKIRTLITQAWAEYKTNLGLRLDY